MSSVPCVGPEVRKKARWHGPAGKLLELLACLPASRKLAWGQKVPRCPVTILWSEDDQWMPIADGRELARRMSDAPFMPVPNAKHLMQEDAPEAIVATTLRFWDALQT